MRIRNTSLALALALGLAAGSTPALAGMPDDIREGVRVELEGKRIDDRTIMAVEVEVLSTGTGDDEIKGLISEVDHAGRKLVIAGVPVLAAEDAAVENADDVPMSFSEFAVGRRAKAEGTYENGVLRAHRVKFKHMTPGEESEVDVGSRVLKVDRMGGTFSVMGIDVLVTPTTAVEIE